MNATELLIELNSVSIELSAQKDKQEELALILKCIAVITEQAFQIETLSQSRDFWKQQFTDLS